MEQRGHAASGDLAASLICALVVWTFLAWWVGKPAFRLSRKTFDVLSSW
jgi:hypothetical protein